MKRSLMLLGAMLLLCNMSAWAQDDAVAKEDKKFEGTWNVVSMESGGKKVPEEHFADMTFTFKGKTYEQKVGDMIVEGGKQDLDPSKKPLQMDITVSEGDAKGKKQLAIYEWDGEDTVKICAANHGEAKRPEKFETKEGAGDMIFVLKRKK